MARRKPDSAPVSPAAWSPDLARKFLYFIAAIILMILGVGIAYQLNPGWFGRVAFVPSSDFVPQAAVAANAYDNPKMWIARPGLPDDPSAWRPPAAETVDGEASALNRAHGR